MPCIERGLNVGWWQRSIHYLMVSTDR